MHISEFCREYRQNGYMQKAPTPVHGWKKIRPGMAIKITAPPNRPIDREIVGCCDHCSARGITFRRGELFPVMAVKATGGGAHDTICDGDFMVVIRTDCGKILAMTMMWFAHNGREFVEPTAYHLPDYRARYKPIEGHLNWRWSFSGVGCGYTTEEAIQSFTYSHAARANTTVTQRLHECAQILFLPPNYTIHGDYPEDRSPF